MNGASSVRLQGPDGASAQVSLHGGQLLSWICDGRERLYLSPRARFAPGQAIRGGVPVIFPQFSDRGPGPRHGFARVREWAQAGAGRFVLRDDADTRASWPYAFQAELTVELGVDALAIALQVRNTGAETFAFTAALHTYLGVDDLAGVRIQGLEGRAYADATRAGASAVQREHDLRLDGELDRLYPDIAGGLHLLDGERGLRIDAEGYADTVVWNPGAALAAGLDDLGAGEHARFVCIEAAAVAMPLSLAPGADWRGRQILTVADRTSAA